jgi:hypothetical protein
VLRAAVTPARQKVHLSVEILMFRRRRVIASRATHKEKLQSNRESVAFGPLISGLSKKGIRAGCCIFMNR